ncbi:hypothetical protein [Conexibacter sp. SYSU D00693]|uniref:hypothetical protein n=1 Tax=Conexibacter sp. SYSU D00693 TaxID=2812560 RepID=UPI00196B6E96|nr:hypothetical protein [Conexibacter sp. SYSU D00693]
MPATVHAAPVSAQLKGENGFGSFDPALPCGVGDGPSWRYAWEDGVATSPGGLFGGLWNGSFEVHDAGASTAFIPDSDGRIALQLPTTGSRVGTASFDTAGGQGCANAGLTLTPLSASDPTSQKVTGTIPVVAKGGTGALRGLTGSGTAQLSLELTPGADNDATLDLNGNFTVAAPELKVSGVQARWANLSEWLQRRLTLYVGVAGTAGKGNAYDVRLTGVGGGSGSFSGVPTGTQTVLAGGGATFSFKMNNVNWGQKYTVSVTAAGKDGLLVPQPPVSGPVTFTAPLLP